MVEQKPTVDQRHVDQRIVDQRIAETLQSFPRVRAKQDFTAGVLERLQTAPKASRWTFTRGWLPLLAAAVLTVAVVWQTQRVDKERQRLASQARIEALRGERQALEAELDTLRRLASGSRPVLYLGADQGVDLVYDLSRLKQGDKVKIPSYLQDETQLSRLEENVPLATWPWVASQGMAAPGMTSSGRRETRRSASSSGGKGQDAPFTAATRTLY